MPLDAVQEVAVAVAAGGRLDGRDVETGPLLSDRVAFLAVPGDGGPDVAVDLIRGGHGGQPRRGSGRHPAERVGDPAKLFLHEHLLQGRAATAAEFLRHVGGAETEFAGPLGLPGDHVGGQIAISEFRLDLERDQLVGERGRARPYLEVFLGQPVHRTP